MQRATTDELRRFLSDAFDAMRIDNSLSAPVIEGLLLASLRGVDSHGIRLAPHYIAEVESGRINTAPQFTWSQQAAASATLDANHTFGISAGVMGMDRAIALARENGIGAVAVKNSTHFGAAAIYTLKAAQADMIGIAMTNTDALVVPHGGAKAFLGTNAWSFAAPADEADGPFCLDMATSIISFNKVRMHRASKTPLDPGLAVDKDGQSCTDPEQAVALQHFGSYKGYGFATTIEILCSMLTGMPFGPDITPMFGEIESQRELGHFFIAIDISKFQDPATFRSRLKGMMDRMRATPPAGENPVMVADDPEKKAIKERKTIGIPLDEKDRAAFDNLAAMLKITPLRTTE